LSKLLKICVAVLAVLALSGTAVAGPTTAKITANKVKKIAKAQIAKAAPTLTVKSAGTATNAANAANAAKLGGKTAAQLKTVIAATSSASAVADVGSGTEVASVDFTVAAPSTMIMSATVELVGNAGEQGRCILGIDDANASQSFETDFAGSGALVLAVNSPALQVAPGTHTAQLTCFADSGTVGKDVVALQVTAVPN
jgi:hypothetical protein